MLAADTEVLCDGEVLGKPADEVDAVAMLGRLQGRAHEVLTGVCLVAGGAVRSGVERSVVRFAPIWSLSVYVPGFTVRRGLSVSRSAPRGALKSAVA